MLRGMHKASSTWIGKAVMAAIMGFLVISFAIWGIGDIFRGYGRNSVAKVGGTEISIEQFRQYYNEHLRQLSRQLRRPITADKARALGLDRQILGQMLAELTLDETAHNLGLGLSDAMIADSIKEDPIFRGADGKFDRQRFEQIINQAGYTEARFVDQQRQVLLRRQIAQSISGDLRVPDTAINLVDRFRNEKRSIEYIDLGPAQASDVPAPTQQQITKYYNDNKPLFRAPEYRRLTLLAVTPAEVADPAAVSNADAKAYYEQHKDKYGKPEKREVRQIVFPNAEEAAAAHERMTKGATFDDIAKTRGLEASDTDLGMVTKAAVIDPAVAKAAFSLKSGEVSQPIKGRFGTVLVTVGKIEPGKQQSFASVEPQIKETIAETRATQKLGDLRDKIEDAKAAGATVAEAAKKLGLKVRVIDAVDRSGRGPDGQPIPNLPKSPDIVAAAFASDVDVDNEALQLPKGGYLYFDVNGITSSRERSLAEVKDKVTTDWRNDQVAKRLKVKAKDIVAMLKSGSTLAQLASAAGLTVQKESDLQRGKRAGFLPATVVHAAFRTAKGVPASADGETETQVYIFQVTDVVDPKLNPRSLRNEAIARTLQNSYADDIIGEYIAHLEKNYGVSINQSALNQVIGGGEPGG